MTLSIALTILVIHLLIALELIRGSRRIAFLRLEPELSAQQLPSVTVIAAARNEERRLKEALVSLLDLDYPNLEVIMVDDRSTDRTGAILEELAEQHRNLRIIHIDRLPGGWLGKNHALWVAAQQAPGDWLLFTDADVIVTPDTLSRALGHAQRYRLDHLAVTPEARMPGFLLNAFALTFGLFFALYTRPWKAADSSSRAHIGIGAFNLVRRSVYDQVGGHRTIALRPDDDLKLGKIIKAAGFRQAPAYGTGLIRVEWYSSLKEVVRGLEKNLFAGTDYRIWLSLGGVLCLLGGWFWPYLGLFASSGPARVLYGLCVVLISLQVADGAQRFGGHRGYVLGFPLTVLLLAAITLRTLLCNLLRGGITWRDTFYPLDELRRNRVAPEFPPKRPDND